MTAQRTVPPDGFTLGQFLICLRGIVWREALMLVSPWTREPSSMRAERVALAVVEG